MSSRSPICAMCLSASSRARPRPTSLTRCYPGLGRPHRPRPPSRADARGAVATLTNNVLINLRPRPGYLTILLLDTSKDVNGLPRDVVNFINAVRFQCAAIPREETVACDSRFLDSIDFSGLQMKGDTEPQPSLTRSWIIGHEIGHVVLKHGSERYGFLNPIDTIQHQSKQDLPKTESAALDPPDSACKQIAEEDNQHLRRLF